uniref:(northern house mosquito) hypothetical protein n=1 Tax=Culex pipiens TaxID=7175 RepID=A0A8D8EUT0_CULPI
MQDKHNLVTESRGFNKISNQSRICSSSFKSKAPPRSSNISTSPSPVTKQNRQILGLTSSSPLGFSKNLELQSACFRNVNSLSRMPLQPPQIRSTLKRSASFPKNEFRSKAAITPPRHSSHGWSELRSDLGWPMLHFFAGWTWDSFRFRCSI